ncbi:4-carboxymuconolactone decarboxylase [Devosia riboflavina]|uniref:4-carboxymuconolactone decarboxylase n=1 Tax=Devosia riboflavina TaxID=46914 RepID=A0A087LZI3_9HYPH|nr:carboxymuconolactone decarboxylase family protein [Devosia riboflavina]KFL30036.1 4-carboxymuconolactone decarboxylase [Devosia riboflavina]
MENSPLFEKGLEVRKAVMGKDYVERALQAADDLTQPLQTLVTEFAWGTIWTRPGLDRNVRSLVNVGTLMALNRPHELHQHVRGALRNGCTKEQVVEVVLQNAIYCGCPAALDAMRIVRTAFSEADAEQASSAPAASA